MILLATMSGSSAFKPVADFDARLAIVGKDEENDAVVVLTLADAPGLGGALREILEGIFSGNFGKVATMTWFDVSLSKASRRAFKAATT